MAKTYLVTGGFGFLGSALVRRLLVGGHAVRVLDNESRGHIARLADLAGAFEHFRGDIRDAAAVDSAVRGVDSVCHLAFVNGTQFFYSQPELVLDVGLRGIINTLDATIRHNVPEFLLLSSSEVYQDAAVIPTPETVPLLVPDPLNPRYSYAGGKIISELMALHYGRNRLGRVLIVRPHNVYGPDMGWEHVIPELVLRMKSLIRHENDIVQVPIQGTGEETRSFVYLDDFIDGLMVVLEHGVHSNIYNVGTQEEVTITALARKIAQYFGKDAAVIPGPPARGAARRRCPDIGKVRALGFTPRICLDDGLTVTAKWYDENCGRAPAYSEVKR